MAFLPVLRSRDRDHPILALFCRVGQAMPEILARPPPGFSMEIELRSGARNGSVEAIRDPGRFI
jgi:hypothetical protein